MGVDYANYALYAVHVISEKLCVYAIDNRQWSVKKYLSQNVKDFQFRWIEIQSEKMFSDNATFHLLENSGKTQLSLFDQQCLKNCQFLKKFTISYVDVDIGIAFIALPVCKFRKENCICNL